MAQRNPARELSLRGRGNGLRSTSPGGELKATASRSPQPWISAAPTSVGAMGLRRPSQSSESLSSSKHGTPTSLQQHQCPDPPSSIRPRLPCVGRRQGCTYSVCPRQKASMLCGAAAQLTRIFSSRSAVSTNWSSGLTAYITRGDRKKGTHWAAKQIPSECLDFLQATMKAFRGAQVQLEEQWELAGDRTSLLGRVLSLNEARAIPLYTKTSSNATHPYMLHPSHPPHGPAAASGLLSAAHSLDATHRRLS